MWNLASQQQFNGYSCLQCLDCFFEPRNGFKIMQPQGNAKTLALLSKYSRSPRLRSLDTNKYRLCRVQVL